MECSTLSRKARALSAQAYIESNAGQPRRTTGGRRLARDPEPMQSKERGIETLGRRPPPRRPPPGPPPPPPPRRPGGGRRLARAPEPMQSKERGIETLGRRPPPRRGARDTPPPLSLAQ